MVSLPSVAAEKPPTNLLIVGSTSGIAKAMARLLVHDALRDKRSLGLILAGRDQSELDRQAADLRTRSECAIATRRYDAADLDSTAPFFADCLSALPGGISGIVLAHGAMPEEADVRANPAIARQLIDVNYTSMVLLLEMAAKHFESQSHGFLCAISSVAGDRGRRKNYAYGATKAALTTYLQGLRSRLQPLGIPVLTVKPGFVDTSMIWGLVPPGSPLNSQPERVAGDILKAIRRQRNVIYTPWFWRIIMGIVKAIPEPIFKRMSF